MILRRLKIVDARELYICRTFRVLWFACFVFRAIYTRHAGVSDGGVRVEAESTSGSSDEHRRYAHTHIYMHTHTYAHTHTHTHAHT